LKHYHAYHHASISMSQFIPYLPKVMNKIVDNVAYYVQEIEENSP